MDVLVFPRVFKTEATQKLYLCADFKDVPAIKIQPMEAYSIPHTALCRIDEEQRYPYLSASKEGGAYFVEYVFPTEGRYTVKIKSGGELVYFGYVYVVGEDLRSLKPFKGDTHTHTSFSDGHDTPFVSASKYYAAGYDFVAVTDHHKLAHSLDAAREMRALTDRFTVFPGEEVHNKDMGYFHIVNFGGTSSVNDIIETDDDYVARELARIKSERRFPDGVNPDTAAYRIFISEHIRTFGGISVLAHPFWEAYGEYNMEYSELKYHLAEGNFDALELFAGNDHTGNGDNLALVTWCELIGSGARASILGASDNHNSESLTSLFNKSFTLVFAQDKDGIIDAVRSGSTVAVKRRDDGDFFVFGSYRMVNYARFLLREFYPEYARLTSLAAKELCASQCAGAPTSCLVSAEEKLNNYCREFFGEA